MTTPQQLTQQLLKRGEEHSALFLLWRQAVEPNTVPNRKQFDIWLDRYPFDIVVRGIRRAGDKLAAHQGVMSQEDEVRYASAVMRDTLKSQREKAVAREL
jgi:hypothetical protein